MLDFQRQAVNIAHINVRTEMHGDEEVTAVDLRLTFDVPNLVLDKLSPTLRASLYETANDPDMLGPDDAHLTHVKNLQLGTLRWAGEYEPVTLHLYTGAKPRDTLQFSDANFGKITFLPQEGGTCSFTTRVQILPSADQAARLVMLLKHEVPATLDAENAVNVDDAANEDE